MLHVARRANSRSRLPVRPLTNTWPPAEVVNNPDPAHHASTLPLPAFCLPPSWPILKIFLFRYADRRDLRVNLPYTYFKQNHSKTSRAVLSLSRTVKRGLGFKLLIWQESIWIQFHLMNAYLHPLSEIETQMSVKSAESSHFWALLFTCLCQFPRLLGRFHCQSWAEIMSDYVQPHIIKKCKAKLRHLLYTTIQSLGSSFKRNDTFSARTH